jgi:hypothetical protein
VNEGVRHVDLEGGARLSIRPTNAGDRELLRSLFHELSTNDRYRRFFSPFNPDDEFLDRLATANEHGACQLIAVTQRDGEPDTAVGEAGAWPCANGNAELAITVRSGARGWLGPYLLDALVEVAGAQGIPNLEAEVLLTNRRMLALLRPRGFAASRHDGFQTARFVISTSGSTPDWPAVDDRPRLLVEAPAGRWDGEETATAAGVQLMVCPGPLARTRRPCPVLAGEHCPLADGADAIVLHLGEGLDNELSDAHAHLTPAVPVCVHPTGANVFDVAEHAAALANERHGS